MSDSLLVLIADDSDTDRLLLQAIIRSQGHRPLLARDGLEAIKLYEAQRPDIILLDAIMPNMDGFQTARHIKANMGDDFVPIIFLTSLHDADSLAQCLEAGGDDFLSKPYQNVILSAKINAFRRMQTMHATMLQQRDQIFANNQRLIQEQEIAKRTFDKVAHEGALQSKNIEYSVSPMAIFNGDVLLAAAHPNGDLCVLLGDFTGHGLSAAIGAMPLSQTFYSMIAKGFAIRFVAREINKKLKEILPVGVFCCAAILQFNFNQQSVEVFNAAMPDLLLINEEGEIADLIESQHLALGILSDQRFNDATLTYSMPIHWKLFAYSDGAIEAENPAGEMFGSQRLLKTICDTNNLASTDTSYSVIPGIKASLDDFVGSAGMSDDLSMIGISMCSKEAFDTGAQEQGIAPKFRTMSWRFSYELSGATLRYADPTPVIQKLIQDAPLFSNQMTNIYTVISELFVNALDHGVLGLSSAIKQKDNGFKLYYQERLKRLEDLEEGFVKFDVVYKSDENGYLLTLIVTDSGQGFDFSSWLKSSNDTGNSLGLQLGTPESGVVPLSGRGLTLVKNLTNSMRIHSPGNTIEVDFKV